VTATPLLDAEVQGPGPRPRRRRPVIVVILVVLTVVAWGGLVAVRSAGLVGSPAIVFGGIAGPVGDEHEQIDAPAYPGAYQWDFYPSGTFGITIAIRNDGGRAVRLTDFPVDGAEHYWRREAVEVSELLTPERCCVPGDWQALEPVTLAPGDLRMVRLTYRFADCQLDEDQWATWSWTTQRVSYEVWGMTRTFDLELPMVMAVRAGGDCPTAFNQTPEG
jgi:hypothetical protein